MILPPGQGPGQNLSEAAYDQIKRDVFEFRRLPGDRFTENEVARALGMSRTPVREALNRLAQEGHLSVVARSGWMVRPLDFAMFDQLYDARIVLELAAVRRLCEQESAEALGPLRDIWLVPAASRLTDERAVAALDEQFHELLVVATGNLVMAQMHREVTERIRIIRRLDFTDAGRVTATYDEHAQVLRSILRRKADHACMLLRSHIETSKRAVRKITLHRLFLARNAGMPPLPAVPAVAAILSGRASAGATTDEPRAAAKSRRAVAATAGRAAGSAGRTGTPRPAGQPV
ncbi:MAG: GntR family transcriptional regulator [Burkholderiales bacterium]|jgi:DNA-binding GntR family transcriptional regulator|nr:GntR family transcriptional regulator [Burkholderiales bacterium]